LDKRKGGRRAKWRSGSESNNVIHVWQQGREKSGVVWLLQWRSDANGSCKECLIVGGCRMMEWKSFGGDVRESKSIVL